MFKLVLVFSVLTAAACGSDGVAIDDFTSKYVDAYCAQRVKCGSAESIAACKASVALNDTEFLTILDAARNGTIDYDDGTAGKCIDSIHDANCNFEGLYEQSPCDDLFVGTVAQGGACFLSLECAGDAECQQTDPNCDSDTTCCPGTCGAPVNKVASGGSCGENDVCADGTYCKPPASGTGNGVCTALLTMSGATCDSFFACANPMVCNLFADMPTCETSAPSGGTCNPDQLIPCADGREHCDATTLKCVGPLAIGAACETSDQCPNYASCNGTCQADLGVGATCSDTTPDCAGSLDCTNGTCQLPPPGMSCL